MAARAALLVLLAAAGDAARRRPDVLYAVVTPTQLWLHCAVPKAGTRSTAQLFRSARVRGSSRHGLTGVQTSCVWTECTPNATALPVLRSALLRNPYARFVSAYRDKFADRADALRPVARVFASAGDKRIRPGSLPALARDAAFILGKVGPTNAEIAEALRARGPLELARLLARAVRQQPALLTGFDRHVRPAVHQCWLDTVAPDYVGALERLDGLSGWLAARGVLDLNGTTAWQFARSFHRGVSRRRRRRRLGAAANSAAARPPLWCEDYSAELRALVDELYAVDFAYIRARRLYSEDELWPCAAPHANESSAADGLL